MYQDYFQLAERPFTTTPYAPHYCPIRYFDQALNTTRHAISEATGPALVIGSAGIGKSMFLEVLAEKYRGFFKIARMSCNPDASRAEMIQQILFELDRPYQGMNEGELRLSLLEYLKAGEKCPNGALILADDAHLLTPELLAELNAISSFVRDGIPRVRLVLAGKPRLEETLTLPSLDSLAQRISARCYLQAMTREQTKSYIDQHLLRTGRSSTEVFEANAIELVAEITQGIPRVVNQVCCHAMILTADNCSPTVTESVVADAWHDIQQLPGSFTSHLSNSVSDPLTHDDLDSQPDNAKFENVGVVEFGSFEETPINSHDLVESNEHASHISQTAEPVLPREILEDVATVAAQLDSGAVDRPKLFVKFGDEDTNEPANTTIEQTTSTKSTPVDIDSTDSQQLKPRRTTDQSVFGNDFDQEEVVADPFSQWAAQQNRSSLQVSDSELTELMAHAEEIKKQLAAHEICAAEPEVLLPGDSIEAATAEESEAESEDQISSHRVAESIPLQELSRLNNPQEQTSITVETSNDLPTQDSISTFAASAQLDSMHNEHADRAETVIEDSNNQSANSEYPLHEHDAYLNPAVQLQNEDPNNTPSTKADDRDILLVSHRNRNQTQARVDENEESVGDPSRGHAKRMDYRELFEMLREPTQS